MAVLGIDGKKRCFGGEPGKELMTKYHDTEWGFASHDDQHLFEMLILEGAQAGLNWEMILAKRNAYQKVFHHFNLAKVATMSDAEMEAACQNATIIRNRLKIYSARHNAQIFLKIQQEFGSFNQYVWAFVHNKPIMHDWAHHKEWPVTSPESIALSKDLKKRGMKFVGPTIIYALMQAVGMVNDHTTECWLYGKKLKA